MVTHKQRRRRRAVAGISLYREDIAELLALCADTDSRLSVDDETASYGSIADYRENCPPKCKELRIRSQRNTLSFIQTKSEAVFLYDEGDMAAERAAGVAIQSLRGTRLVQPMLVWVFCFVAVFATAAAEVLAPLGLRARIAISTGSMIATAYVCRSSFLRTVWAYPRRDRPKRRMSIEEVVILVLIAAIGGVLSTFSSRLL